MKLIKVGYEILTKIDGQQILKNIEAAGRTAYKSEDKITEGSAEKFVKMIIRRGHFSVIEHESFSVRFVIDRGISHEMVRHRLASFTQESTRYCNYQKKNEGGELNVINIKEHMTASQYDIWIYAIKSAELSYNDLINDGCSPQIARSVLPNSLKTEIVVTANLREWYLIFTQRTAKVAHPQMREIMRPLLNDIKLLIPIIFDGINYE